MTALEQELRALAVEWPPTPDLATAVEGRLGPQPRRRAWLRPVALAAAALVVAVGALLALSPGARSAFLELFHLKGVTVTRVERLPPTRTLRPLDPGEPVSRAEAQRRAGFTLEAPKGLGEPQAVYERAGIVTFVYRAEGRPRLLFSQVRAAVDQGFAKKLGAIGTRVQFVRVSGEPGLFLSGEPHLVAFLDPSGRQRVEPVYLAGTVLLWEHGALTLRLEGDLTLARALELARSVE